jgi:hypothetical protein
MRDNTASKIMFNIRGEPFVQGAKFVPLYEQGAIVALRAKFLDLLTQQASEEVYQEFIENNPVLLHPFSPMKLYFKAPVLSLRKTDFALVNSQGELLLIELERPHIKLLKKDGDRHSELNHAFDQVHEWLHHADEHRAAVLDCIGVKREQVGAVRGVVIAGRDRDCNPEHLRRLKGADLGRIRFLTFDDLVASLDSLTSNLECL